MGGSRLRRLQSPQTIWDGNASTKTKSLSTKAFNFPPLAAPIPPDKRQLKAALALNQFISAVDVKNENSTSTIEPDVDQNWQEATRQTRDKVKCKRIKDGKKQGFSKISGTDDRRQTLTGITSNHLNGVGESGIAAGNLELQDVHYYNEYLINKFKTTKPSTQPLITSSHQKIKNWSSEDNESILILLAIKTYQLKVVCEKLYRTERQTKRLVDYIDNFINDQSQSRFIDVDKLKAHAPQLMNRRKRIPRAHRRCKSRKPSASLSMSSGHSAYNTEYRPHTSKLAVRETKATAALKVCNMGAHLNESIADSGDEPNYYSHKWLVKKGGKELQANGGRYNTDRAKLNTYDSPDVILKGIQLMEDRLSQLKSHFHRSQEDMNRSRAVSMLGVSEQARADEMQGGLYGMLPAQLDSSNKSESVQSYAVQQSFSRYSNRSCQPTRTASGKSAFSGPNYVEESESTYVRSNGHSITNRCDGQNKSHYPTPITRYESNISGVLPVAVTRMQIIPTNVNDFSLGNTIISVKQNSVSVISPRVEELVE